ncbi:hypothetical protein LCGC14_0657980 [marine sediment metagenome]|uniref:Uncharacterized protein n=1 Tax=marine sediment metagenome TaxID=412755 RepID=A0A0F9QUI5_9ZZZZ
MCFRQAFLKGGYFICQAILLPAFQKWVNDGTKATLLAWFLKSKQLPWTYWNLMLRGREWLSVSAIRKP